MCVRACETLKPTYMLQYSQQKEQRIWEFFKNIYRFEPCEIQGMIYSK